MKVLDPPVSSFMILPTWTPKEVKFFELSSIFPDVVADAVPVVQVRPKAPTPASVSSIMLFVEFAL
jgi:hypothetical protein